MPQKSEAPLGGGASRNQLGGCLRDVSTPASLQSQILIAPHCVRHEVASLFAALAVKKTRRANPGGESAAELGLIDKVCTAS